MSTTPADMIELHGYQLQLPTFEGPLDVLLRLIEREQLPITEISLMAVTDQFLAYLGALHDPAPETIAAFSSVAGRLLVLKSRSLIPRPPIVGEDPAEDDLVQELIEYRALRDAIASLAETDRAGRGAYPLGGSVPVPPASAPKLAIHQSTSLAKALRRRLTALATPPVTRVMRKVVSLQVMAVRLLTMVNDGKPVRFRSYVGPSPTREELMVGFLAVLVLLRRRVIDAEQAEPFGDIDLMRVAGADASSTELARGLE